MHKYAGSIHAYRTFTARFRDMLGSSVFHSVLFLSPISLSSWAGVAAGYGCRLIDGYVAVIDVHMHACMYPQPDLRVKQTAESVSRHTAFSLHRG